MGFQGRLASSFGDITIYTGDGAIADITRNVQVRTTLNFNHGAAAVNGYFRLSTNGYVKNQTNVATNFWEYNNNTGIQTYETDTHSVTGVRSTNTGGVNPTAMVEVFAGSNGTAYMNIGATTSRFDFYSNNTAILAGSYNNIGDWGFGTTPSAGAKVTIHSSNGQGFGTIISTGNLSPAEAILSVRTAAAANAFYVSATGRTTISTECWIGTNTGSIPVASPLAVKGYDSSFLTRNFGFWDISDNPLFQMQNDGSIGINAAPLSGDRVKITAGSRDGAININANNVNNSGYGVLVQGGTAGADFQGFWCDVTIAGTGINRAFRGSSGTAGGTQNFGGHFLARNGSNYSVGVFGGANGGDAVNPSEFAAGVWGDVGAIEADDRRAGNFSIGAVPDVANSISYGTRSELTWVSVLDDETNFGSWNDCSVDGDVLNVAGYFTAAGGGAENIALMTNDGIVVLGDNASSSVLGSLVEVYGDIEFMTNAVGPIIMSPDNTKWRIVVDNAGALSAVAA